MIISCQQADLKRGLATVSHAVAPKGTLPALAHVFIASDNGRLKLVATDLEISITCWIEADIEKEGTITIPAKLLSDVVGGLPNDRVTLTLDARTLSVKVECGRFVSNIKGGDPDDFPSIPAAEEHAPALVLPPDVLRQAINQVAFAAATDASRPVLTGVFLGIGEEGITMAAADGFRLAKKSYRCNTGVSAESIIIPARTLEEMARILGGVTSDVSIIPTANGTQVIFHTDTLQVMSRLIDGNFPDFERIIPSEYQIRTVLETQSLTKAAKLASYFASASQGIIKLEMPPDNDTLLISANAAEVGDNSTTLSVTRDGNDDGGQVGVNSVFLLEALSVIKTEQIAIETVAPDRPIVLKPVGDDTYTHVIMPMTLR